MRATVFPVVGGPLDGRDVLHDGAPYAWVGQAAKTAAFPSRGRVLYRRDGEVLLYAGDTHGVCSCGAYGAKGQCILCGQPVPPRSRRELGSTGSDPREKA
jgi:hypothetical protein